MINKKTDLKIDTFLAEIPEIVLRVKEMNFLIGNCYVRKRKYLIARQYYEESIAACLENKNHLWHGSGQVNLLVDILILSRKLDLVKKVEVELKKFYREPQHDTWPVSFYAFSIIELLQNRTPDIWIEKLVDNPKNNEAINLGVMLNGIVNNNEIGFNASLNELLQAHDRRVKYGALRETPEGFISMDGMAMVFLAKKRGLSILLESQYIAPDYFSH
jgi:hypothetical protein